MKYFFLASLLALCLKTPAQDSLFFDTADMAGSRILNEQHFTGSNLWGHIDGAADLYLEYGFLDLRSYKLQIDSIRLDLEIYRFGNPYESLGLFSIKKFGCLQDNPDLNPMFCQTRYALTFPVSSWYVTIAGPDGNAEEQQAERKLADIIYAKPVDKGLTMKDIFPPGTGDFTFADYKIIMGPLGFQNGLPDWSSRFGDYKGYVCIWYDVKKGDKDIDVFLLNFKKKDQLERMLRENGWQINDDELTIPGETNWLISRRGDMLMILSGQVPVDVLRDLKSLE